MKKRVLYPLIIGLSAFVITIIITLFINSPYPFWASFIIGFLIFETSYFYYFRKEKRQTEIENKEY
jgi:Na+-driven multidrug efflux pump